MATSGEFRTSDGSTIKIGENSLKADIEAFLATPAGHYRAYASQIFQVADYDAETGLVSIDNQCGEKFDRVSGSRRLSTKDLFLTANPPKRRS